MKKLNDWILPILFILLAISFFFLQNGVVKEYEIKTKFYKSKLGEEFILDKKQIDEENNFKYAA